jgi:hypothetical protein
MLASASGQELVAKGYAEDVELASQVDAPGARAARFMEARYVPVAG